MNLGQGKEAVGGGGSVRKIHTHILQITCNVDYAHIPAERNIEIQMEEYLRRDTKMGGRKTPTQRQSRGESGARRKRDSDRLGQMSNAAYRGPERTWVEFSQTI